MHENVWSLSLALTSSDENFEYELIISRAMKEWNQKKKNDSEKHKKKLGSSALSSGV